MTSNTYICCPVWYLHNIDPMAFPLCQNACQAIVNDYVQDYQRYYEQRTAFLAHAWSNTPTLLQVQAETETQLLEHAILTEGIETLLQQCQLHEYWFGEQAEVATWAVNLQWYCAAIGEQLHSRFQDIDTLLPKRDYENYETQQHTEPFPLLPSLGEQLREELRADSPIEGAADAPSPYNGPPIGTPTRTVHINDHGKQFYEDGGVSPYVASALHNSLQWKWVHSSPWGCVTRICLDRECETCFPSPLVKHDSVVQSVESSGDEWEVSDSEEAVEPLEQSYEDVWHEILNGDVEGRADWISTREADLPLTPPSARPAVRLPVVQLPTSRSPELRPSTLRLSIGHLPVIDEE